MEALDVGAAQLAQVSLPMGWFREEVPLFVPGVVLAALAGLLLARPLARKLGERPLSILLLVLGLGFIVAATLTPLVGALEEGRVSSGTCDTGRIGPAAVAAYARVGDASLNVALFVPFGFALGLLRGRRARSLIALSLLLPVAVEAAQMLVPSLGRGCETADIIDDTLGLLIGFIAGVTTAKAVATVWSGRKATQIDRGRGPDGSGLSGG